MDLYNITAYVQNHTLINRGITTLGGSTIPQCIMSNNKYEAQERAIMGGIYFIASYLTPLALLPLYNKHFLKNEGIIKSFNGMEKNIIQVSKKYLTSSSDLKKGLKETAKAFDKDKSAECEKEFLKIYNNYSSSDILKKNLLKVHQKVLSVDFMTTAAMWSAIPWIATERTERKTNRTDFSAGFNLKSDEQKSKENLKKEKLHKMLWNIILCVFPALIFSKTVTKGLGADLSKTKGLKKKLYKFIQNNAEKYDYTSGTNMSKTIYAAIWLLSSFPAKIISSRDKNERKDRAIRDIGLFTMFFGGDYLINNLTGRFADKFLKTEIMDYEKYKGKNLNFLERFKLSPKNFKTLDESVIKNAECLNRTKKIGAGLYWVSLLTNTALIGFALPKFLNKFLRKNIENERKTANV